MKKITLYVLSVALVMLSQAQANTETSKTVRIGVASFGNYVKMIEEGKYDGLEAKIAEEICEKNKWNCIFSEADFFTVFDDVVGYKIEDGKPNLSLPVEKKYDMVIGAIDAAADRLEFMDFSKTYYSGRHLFMKAGHVRELLIHQPSGFPIPKQGEKLKIAVEAKSALNGELVSFYSNPLIDRLADIEIVNFRTNKEGIADFKKVIDSGEVDLVFTFFGSPLQADAPDFKLTQATGELGVVDTNIVRGVGIGMAKSPSGANDLKVGADKVISDILTECRVSKDCRFNEWIQTYFPDIMFDPNPGIVPAVDFQF